MDVPVLVGQVASENTEGKGVNRIVDRGIEKTLRIILQLRRVRDIDEVFTDIVVSAPDPGAALANIPFVGGIETTCPVRCAAEVQTGEIHRTRDTLVREIVIRGIEIADIPAQTQVFADEGLDIDLHTLESRAGGILHHGLLPGVIVIGKLQFFLLVVVLHIEEVRVDPQAIVHPLRLYAGFVVVDSLRIVRLNGIREVADATVETAAAVSRRVSGEKHCVISKPVA